MLGSSSGKVDGHLRWSLRKKGVTSGVPFKKRDTTPGYSKERGMTPGSLLESENDSGITL